MARIRAAATAVVLVACFPGAARGAQTSGDASRPAHRARAAAVYAPVPEYSGRLSVTWDWSNVGFSSTSTAVGEITLEPVRGDTIGGSEDLPIGLDYRVVSLTSSGTQTDASGVTCTMSDVVDEGANQPSDGLVDSVDLFTTPHTWQRIAYLGWIHVIRTVACPGQPPTVRQAVVELNEMSSPIHLVNQVDRESARYRLVTDTTVHSSAEDGYTATVRVVADLTRVAPSSPYSQYPGIEVVQDVPPAEGHEVSPGYVIDRVTVRSAMPVKGARVSVVGEPGPERAYNEGVVSHGGGLTDSRGVITVLAARRKADPPCYSAQVIPLQGETVAGESDIVCAGPQLDAGTGLTKILARVVVVGVRKVGKTVRLTHLISRLDGRRISYVVTWAVGSKVVKRGSGPRLRITPAMRGRKIKVRVSASVGGTSRTRTIRVGRAR